MMMVLIKKKYDSGAQFQPPEQHLDGHKKREDLLSLFELNINSNAVECL